MEDHIDEPIADGQKRILGHAAGKIRFTDGWEEPLTEAEFQEFIGEAD